MNKSSTVYKKEKKKQETYGNIHIAEVNVLSEIQYCHEYQT